MSFYSQKTAHGHGSGKAGADKIPNNNAKRSKSKSLLVLCFKGMKLFSLSEFMNFSLFFYALTNILNFIIQRNGSVLLYESGLRSS